MSEESYSSYSLSAAERSRIEEEARRRQEEARRKAEEERRRLMAEGRERDQYAALMLARAGEWKEILTREEKAIQERRSLLSQVETAAGPKAAVSTAGQIRRMQGLLDRVPAEVKAEYGADLGRLQGLIAGGPGVDPEVLKWAERELLHVLAAVPRILAEAAARRQDSISAVAVCVETAARLAILAEHEAEADLLRAALPKLPPQGYEAALSTLSDRAQALLEACEVIQRRHLEQEHARRILSEALAELGYSVSEVPSANAGRGRLDLALLAADGRQVRATANLAGAIHFNALGAEGEKWCQDYDQLLRLAPSLGLTLSDRWRIEPKKGAVQRNHRREATQETRS